MRKFHEIFVGRTDAYGIYALPKGQIAKRGTKFLGKAKTVTDGELTEENYKAHLDGKTGLGIVPIIPKDNTVSWFVIDVDKYGEDDLHGSLAVQINKLNLPLLVCKSKSGGAHLYCFLTEPSPAKDVLDVARKFAKKLGLDPKVEIFPKQETIGTNDAGSWINLPYFGETRPCMGVDGKTELSLKEFLLFVHEREVHPSDLDVRVEELQHREDTGSKAPPCIDRMIDEGVEEGGRDNALTHVTVYLKKRYPDDWQDRVADFNGAHITPPLKFGDVARIIKGGERKEYQYLCKQQPMCALCDQAACFKREYGIGDGVPSNMTDFAIDSIRRIDTEEPIFIVVVDGVPVRMDINTLTTYRLFRIEFAKRTNRLLKPMKPNEWDERLAPALEAAEVESAPEIVGASGQIRHHFMEWTGQMMQTGSLQRCLEGYPVYNKKTITFRGTDFISYLRRQGGRFDDSMVWLVLNEDGAEQESVEINKSNRKVWVYPVGEPWFDPPTKSGKF